MLRLSMHLLPSPLLFSDPDLPPACPRSLQLLAVLPRERVPVSGFQLAPCTPPWFLGLGQRTSAWELHGQSLSCLVRAVTGLEPKWLFDTTNQLSMYNHPFGGWKPEQKWWKPNRRVSAPNLFLIYRTECTTSISLRILSGHMGTFTMARANNLEKYNWDPILNSRIEL